jgi:hypothetical protein
MAKAEGGTGCPFSAREGTSWRSVDRRFEEAGHATVRHLAWVGCRGRFGGPSGRRGRLAGYRTASDSDSGTKDPVGVADYLKGDPVGAIDDEDVVVFARAELTLERIMAVLERSRSGSRPSGRRRSAMTGRRREGSRFCTSRWNRRPIRGSERARRRGWPMYALLAGRWGDEQAVGEPTIYAGGGWATKRDEREAIGSSNWPAVAAEAEFESLSDRDGSYVFQGRPLAEIVAAATTLSEQVDALAGWAGEVFDRMGRLPAPPSADLRNTGRQSTARLRALRVGRKLSPKASAG